MSKRIGVIGSGNVGQTLANGFIKHGFEVMIGTNDKTKYPMLNEKTAGKAKVGNFEETAKFGEIIVLAVKGSAAEKAVRQIGLDILGDKIIIDTTNPIADTAPVNGVLSYFTSINESLMERLQNLAPKSRFIKSFSCVGAARMVNPDFSGVKPTMFICGNDQTAKTEVTKILDRFGWEHEDMGAAEAARAIEPLAMLWCIPGFRQNRWMHAFKLLDK
jgi:8-hydroxy-5-deazaflavin:NADPH oxidoreductase